MRLSKASFLAGKSFGAAVAMQSLAFGQNVAPFGFTLDLGPGLQVYVNMGGAGLWKGITKDEVDAAEFGSWVSGHLPWEPHATMLPRAKIQSICPEHCQAAPSMETPPKEDIVRWRDGTQTTGKVEVRCGDYNECSVYQNGKTPRADTKWESVAYIYFGRSKAP